ncbi:Nitric oxide-dependent regulator DnrN or NorA [Fulvivirga imtechensis AK7]|uniref:Nitric oxide-dependent regulator DnrN or NorA n=1 Tax=Fulvivirga imtechensis AK7 TaxID=1237149 RepID=L8JT33_9BACT|nr:iron-sulfur cluster repair di-iron protein [Fulvivirga imtechensis]ELR72005.1 Nitric oxide-dependent regulator DnrN or NorA [Fulvivirga imtechensis AK7]
MRTEHLLDVRIIEPKLKHPTIFQRFDELETGEQLTIVNDHDPLPLYYQFKAERPEQFEWNYLQEGPDAWRVGITKTAQIKTVADVLVDNPKAATVFKKYNIDFCCKGARPLDEACAEAGVRSDEILQEIDKAEEIPQFNMRANEWSLDFLTEYIVNNHHKYVRDNAQDLENLADKVAQVHGEFHPELIEIAGIVSEITEDLLEHMEKEEQVLFPAIRTMVSKGKVHFPFGSIRNPIMMMEDEHSEAGQGFDDIRRLSEQYTIPEDACASYRLLFEKLQAFEDDLHQHVHLENNILFPKAIALEDSF